MNKKLLLLSTLLTSSLAIAPVQANWQEWIPSKKALLIKTASTAVTWGIISKIFYNKYADMHNNGQVSGTCLRIKVKSEQDTDEENNRIDRYSPKSKWLRFIPGLSWSFDSND